MLSPLYAFSSGAGFSAETASSLGVSLLTQGTPVQSQVDYVAGPLVVQPQAARSRQQQAGTAIVKPQAKRLGCHEEGRIRRQIYTDGEYHDELIFGLTREEFDELLAGLDVGAT